MSIKPKGVFFILFLLPVAILFQSLTGIRKESCSGSSKISGAPACFSNDPPTNKNCATICHNDGVINTGTAQLMLDLGAANSGYIPGQTYTVNVSITKAGMVSSGFQIIALEDNDSTTSPGVYTLLEPTRTQLIDSVNPHGPYPCGNQLTKTWVEHDANGISGVSPGSNDWSYAWQAPSADVGSITFYLAALEANNNLDPTGDNTYTLTKTISAITPVEDITGLNNVIGIYPNPSPGEFAITTIGRFAKEFSVYDIHGKLLERFNSYMEKVNLDLKKYSKGVYFLRVNGDKSSSINKLVIE